AGAVAAQRTPDRGGALRRGADGGSLPGHVSDRGPAPMPDRRGPAIWISWERHRRSRELARALSVPLYEIVSRRSGRLRSIDCALRTTGLLLRVRPSLLFVQNPSIQLATLASFLKPLFGYTLVVDRHSNFDFSNTRDGLFNRLSNYGLRIADLTIVTNEAVQRLVE